MILQKKIDILVVADIFCALREERPYKKVFSLDKCVSEFISYAPNKLNIEIVNLLIENMEEIDNIRRDCQEKANNFYLESISEN